MKGRAAAALAALMVLVPAAALAVPFTFEVPREGRTSAGVFTRGGTLVRTLWSGVSFGQGRHVGDWDGADDRGAGGARRLQRQLPQSRR